MTPASSGMLVITSVEPLGLVVGQRVHRIEDQRLCAGDSGALGTLDVVEDRIEECLRLSRSGAGSHQSRFRAVVVSAIVCRQPLERGRPDARTA